MCSRQGYGLYCNLYGGFWLAKELGWCGRLHSWLGLCYMLDSWQGLGWGLRHRLDLDFGLSNLLSNRCRLCSWQGCGLWTHLHRTFSNSSWQGLGFCLWHCRYLDLNLWPGLSSVLGHGCRLYNWQGCGLWTHLHRTFSISSWQGLGFCLWYCRYLDLDLWPGLSRVLGHICRLYSWQGCGLGLFLFLDIGCWLFLARSLRNCLGLARTRLWCGLCLGFGLASWLGYRCGLYS